jgi:hypothetical protein
MMAVIACAFDTFYPRLRQQSKVEGSTMFGLFGNRPQNLGGYVIRAYKGQETGVSVDYYGQPLKKAHSLFLRGLYAAKMMFNFPSRGFVEAILGSIAHECVYLEDKENIKNLSDKA